MANSHITIRGGMQPVIFILLMLLAVPLQARENAYDVLGKALVPLARILIGSAKTQSRAVTATLVLDSATNLPANSTGDTLEIALQSPDKAHLRATVAGKSVTISRDGEKLWAFPGAQISALIEGQALPKADPGYKLDQFHLPVTEQQLVLLPVLFQVDDAGDEMIGGEKCMVLDVKLMPDLARAAKATDYLVRLWVRPDYRIAKILVVRRKWQAVITVKTLEYSNTLQPETWQPTADESADVLQLTPSRYKQILDYLSTRWAQWKSDAAK